MLMIPRLVAFVDIALRFKDEEAQAVCGAKRRMQKELREQHSEGRHS